MTLAFAFGTPLWNYSKTFFKEPYLLTFLILAYYLFIVKRSNLLPGILIGICFLSRPLFLVFSFLFFKRIEGKNYQAGLRFIVPIILSAQFLLISNQLIYGNPFAGYGGYFTWPFIVILFLISFLISGLYYCIPPTCHGPVIPGRTLNLCFCHSSRFLTSMGRFGRGPTNDISPFKTLNSCGNSSRQVLRRILPTLVTRGSPSIFRSSSDFLCGWKLLNFLIVLNL